jgi:hypothetical protein
MFINIGYVHIVRVGKYIIQGLIGNAKNVAKNGKYIR